MRSAARTVERRWAITIEVLPARASVRAAWTAASDVESTLSFYTLLRRKPAGKYHILICTNLSCMLQGSDDIEGLFEQYFELRGEPTEPSEFNGRSDYQAFINNGVPAGGLFTGAEGEKTAEQAAKWGGTAGEAYDPCYHQACDTIDNLSVKALQINADAMAYVIFLYASGWEAINQ